MQNQQLTYQYERGYERLTDRLVHDDGEDLTPTHDTVARLKEERDFLRAQLSYLRDWMLSEHVRTYGVTGGWVARAITQILEDGDD